MLNYPSTIVTGVMLFPLTHSVPVSVPTVGVICLINTREERNSARHNMHTHGDELSEHTLLPFKLQFALLNISYENMKYFWTVRTFKANLASEMPYPAPLRVGDQPILIQYTADHICTLLMCAKGACILLNQFT